MTLAPILFYAGRAAPGPPEPVLAAIPGVITFIGSPNFFQGRPKAPIAICIHTMAGFLAGTDATFNDPNVPEKDRASAHFGVALDGTVHQYVRITDRAWSNGFLELGNSWFGPAGENPNDLTVSIETEDRQNPATDVSDAQYQAVEGLCRLILQNFDSVKFLTSHHVISPQTRPNCCGGRWTEPRGQRPRSRIEDLAAAARLELRI